MFLLTVYLLQFTIKIAKDTELYTAVTYAPNNSVLRFDRSHSGFRHNIVASRKALVRYQGGEIKLRFIIDRFPPGYSSTMASRS